MNFVVQLVIIILYSYIGDSLASYFSLSIPGSIIGLLLLFASLQLGVLKLRWVEDAGNWLKGNIAFFFVPVTVSIMTYFDILHANLFELSIILIVSTLITYLISAAMTQWARSKEISND